MRLLMLLVLLLPALSFGSEKEERLFEETLVEASQGDADALFRLAVMLENGIGAPKDGKEAVKWYRLAADRGHAKAQLFLSYKYALGRGVPADNVLAYMWANIAGANGYDVEENMGIISGKMSQADISKAQEKTTKYIKDHPDVY